MTSRTFRCKNVAVQCLFKRGFNIGLRGEGRIEAARFAVAPAGAGVGLQQGLQPIALRSRCEREVPISALWHHHRPRQQVHQPQYAEVDSKRPLLQPQKQIAAPDRDSSPCSRNAATVGYSSRSTPSQFKPRSLARLPSYINGSFSKSTWKKLAANAKKSSAGTAKRSFEMCMRAIHDGASGWPDLTTLATQS